MEPFSVMTCTLNCDTHASRNNLCTIVFSEGQNINCKCYLSLSDKIEIDLMLHSSDSFAHQNFYSGHTNDIFGNTRMTTHSLK